jgi:hypothetical protein
MEKFGHSFVAQSRVHFVVVSKYLTTFVKKQESSLAKQLPTGISLLNPPNVWVPATLRHACLLEMICIKI